MVSVCERHRGRGGRRGWVGERLRVRKSKRGGGGGQRELEGWVGDHEFLATCHSPMFLVKCEDLGGRR